MPEPLPILHVINECSDGSIARIIERIIACSPQNAFEWHICTVKGNPDFADHFTALGAQVAMCISRPGDPAYRQISRYLREHRIRIVHSHTPRTILEAWRGLRHSRQPAAHLATKHLLTTPKDRSWGWLFTLYDRLTLYMPDHLVTVSRTMANEVLAQPGIRRERVTAIPNAIPVDTFYRPAERDASRAELGLPSSTLAIGFTGRITRVKRLDLLLCAFKTIHAQYPHTRLILAGEGDQRPALEALAQESGIAEAVIFTGFCFDVPRLLAALDIYVQPSINEGLSLSLLEALAAAKPLAATRVGSADEIITDGQTGLLIPPGDSGAITAALDRLIQQPELRERLAQQGRAFVKKEYDIQKMVDRYIQLYHSLDARGRGN